MKKILSIAVLLASVSLTTFAQESIKGQKESRKSEYRKEMTKKSPEEIAKMKTAHLDKIVKLNDKQKEEVYTLNLKTAKAHQDRVETRKKQREATRAQMQESRKELNSILSPEQQKLLAENVSKNKEKRMGNHQHQKKLSRKNISKTDNTAKK